MRSHPTRYEEHTWVYRLCLIHTLSTLQQIHTRFISHFSNPCAPAIKDFSRLANTATIVTDTRPSRRENTSRLLEWMKPCAWTAVHFSSRFHCQIKGPSPTGRWAFWAHLPVWAQTAHLPMAEVALWNSWPLYMSLIFCFGKMKKNEVEKIE